jgi:hypothetical protein
MGAGTITPRAGLRQGRQVKANQTQSKDGKTKKPKALDEAGAKGYLDDAYKRAGGVRPFGAPFRFKLTDLLSPAAAR